MDDHPRQNPAYRPATENPRTRGGFLYACFRGNVHSGESAGACSDRCEPISSRRPHAVSFEVVRAPAELGGLVVRVEERAAVDREAAAAYASGQSVPDRLQRGDPPVEVFAP